MENLISTGSAFGDQFGDAPALARPRVERAGLLAGTDEYCPPGPPAAPR